jgi:hypothetical protein
MERIDMLRRSKRRAAAEEYKVILVNEKESVRAHII